MKFPAFAAIAATLVAKVSAHNRVWSIWVHGSDLGAGAGRYIRQPPTNSPVKDLTSSDIRNANGYSPVPTDLSVPTDDTAIAE